MNWWSPRTRGWSQAMPERPLLALVVPAHAGVVPRWSTTSTALSSGPRARGGGPTQLTKTEHQAMWSPRTRGWSRCKVTPSEEPHVVPAHAGVVPSSPSPSPTTPCGPRARGGGPARFCSPDGWLMWSPRTRGWSHETILRRPAGAVVPAHAGVVPVARHAHSDPRRGPRARGGGPQDHDRVRVRRRWSPRTRGWSPARRTRPAPPGVVPAHAGVVPGDGPDKAQVSWWSPRTRGWSNDAASGAADRAVVPAHAGVVPPRRRRPPAPWRGPRARGVVPCPAASR